MVKMSPAVVKAMKKHKQEQEEKKKKRASPNKGKRKDNHKTITCICTYCNQPFEAPYHRWLKAQKNAKKRGGNPRIFCNRDHFLKWQKLQSEGKDPQRIVNWPCAGCGEMITDTYEKWAKGKKFHNKDCQSAYLKRKAEDEETKLKRKVESEKVDVVYKVPYEPHPAQWDVHRSKARFKILSCGTRWGKDRSTINEFIMQFVQMLEEDRPDHLVPRVHGWLVAPSFPMARQIWRELKHFIPPPLVMGTNEADKTMTTIKDGFIEVKSASDPSSMVGVGLDVITVTEAARIPNFEEVWSFLRGRLSSPGRGPGGRGGVAYINSTPNLRHGAFFRKLWLHGKDENNPEWESFQFPTSSNPYIKPSEIEEARKTLPERLFRQEFLAEFLEGEGAVFSNIQKCANGAFFEPDQGETYVLGFDPARSVDYSAIVIRDSKGQAVHIERSTGKPWTWQVNRVEFLSVRYNRAKVIMDRTGLGEALVEALAQRLGDSQVEGVFFTQAVKESLVNHLAYLMEQELVNYPDVDYLISELTDYSYRVSKNGRMSYGAQEGHDDAVTALMLAMRDFDTRLTTLPYLGVLLGAKRRS